MVIKNIRYVLKKINKKFLNGTTHCLSLVKNCLDKSFIVMNTYISYCREGIVTRFFLDESVLNRCTLDLKRVHFRGEREKKKWFNITLRGGGGEVAKLS